MLRTDYIILRKVPFQESSFVVSGISPDYGRLDFLLKGVRGTGARKFPCIGLFRVLGVEFRENRTSSSLLYMSSYELKRDFDRIACYPENYIRLCGWIQFLLKHTRPMLELHQTYRSFLLALSRLCSPAGGEFQLAAAELVFLYESGFVPDMRENDPKRAAALTALLAYALEESAPEPEFSDEYRRRLIQWIHSLSRYADSV